MMFLILIAFLAHDDRYHLILSTIIVAGMEINNDALLFSVLLLLLLRHDCDDDLMQRDINYCDEIINTHCDDSVNGSYRKIVRKSISIDLLFSASVWSYSSQYDE